MPSRSDRPLIALAMGDPAGISPELTAKVLADREARAAADILVIGDRRVLAEGERVARVSADVRPWRPKDGELLFDEGPVLADLGHLDPRPVALGSPSAVGGRFALANFRTALALACRGGADAVVFTPFNKQAMRLAHSGYVDEITVINEVTGAAAEGREFNVLDNLWNARITSHVPLKDVAGLLTKERIVEGLVLTDRCMRAAGFAHPRIAVAGLNPHAGEGGNFGREEIDVIGPAVQEARARGVICEGPFPSDTVFLRARRGDFDAVQTMYHDQGQIAMKLLGFERGVTLIGGYAFPICTPAHGTAYDIAGKGIADPGASRQALLIAARMAPRSGPRSGLASLLNRVAAEVLSVAA